MTTLIQEMHAPSSAPPALLGFLAEIRQLVDADLDRRLRPAAAGPHQLAEAMHYAATGPAKRLRPAVLIAAAEACGSSRARVLPAAAAIEMLHGYTTVHDDLPALDRARTGRGRPTVTAAFGEAIALLAGDALLTEAFGTLAELGSGAAAAVSVLARRAGTSELLLGHALDIASPRGSRDSASLERLHASRSGALFAAAAELGGIVAGAAPQICADLGRYGMAIGVAFQYAHDRDDRDLAQLDELAMARMRILCDEARTIAAGFGLRGSLLDEIAGWIAARAPDAHH